MQIELISSKTLTRLYILMIRVENGCQKRDLFVALNQWAIVASCMQEPESSSRGKFDPNFDQRKGNLVRVSGVFELSHRYPPKRMIRLSYNLYMAKFVAESLRGIENIKMLNFLQLRAMSPICDTVE